MKPFLVVIYNENAVFDFGFRENRNGGVQIAYAERHMQGMPYPEHLQKHPVFYTETEEEAQALAKMLTEKHPGSNWLVARATQFYQSKIVDVKNTVRNITEKGMLP